MLIQGGHSEWRPAVENGFKSCPPADCSFFSPLLVYTCATCISWGGAGAGNNSITGVWQTLPPSSSAPIPPPLGHSQRTCSLPSGMWMCIMEMDGGWLCHTVEQTDSSLNACLPASISLSPTAPPGIEPGLNIGPAQVCVGVCVCVCVCVCGSF